MRIRIQDDQYFLKRSSSMNLVFVSHSITNSLATFFLPYTIPNRGYILLCNKTVFYVKYVYVWHNFSQPLSKLLKRNTLNLVHVIKRNIFFVPYCRIFLIFFVYLSFCLYVCLSCVKILIVQLLRSYVKIVNIGSVYYIKLVTSSWTYSSRNI